MSGLTANRTPKDARHVTAGLKVIGRHKKMSENNNPLSDDEIIQAHRDLTELAIKKGLVKKAEPKTTILKAYAACKTCGYVFMTADEIPEHCPSCGGYNYVELQWSA